MANELAEAMVLALVAAADPTRAPKERRYLKSDRDFLGVSVPEGRRIVRAELRARRVDVDELWAAVDELWKGPWFECRRASVEVLVARAGDLGIDDLDRLAAMIRHGETWALVDPLAIDVAGTIVAANPVGTTGILDTWSTDDSFWLRRASMLALLRSLRVDDEQWPRFCRYADTMLDEREFFIRKAIGWVARDVARRRPATVRPWVEAHLDQMSGVTRREAVKYL